TQSAHVLGSEASQVSRVVVQLKADLASYGSHGRQQPHDGQRGDRLSRSRLPHEAEDAPPGNAEAHIAHCRQRARSPGKLDPQVSYFEEHPFMLTVVLKVALTRAGGSRYFDGTSCEKIRKGSRVEVDVCRSHLLLHRRCPGQPKLRG